MRRKLCRSCKELYLPEPQTYRQQKTCNKRSCRDWRIREKWRRWILKNPLYGQSRKVKQKQWRDGHVGYWKRWRKMHSEYVNRNRKEQKRRDAKKRGFLAKPTEWRQVYIEKLDRIRSLRFLAKPTECEEVLFYQIEGLCCYLKQELLLAKPTDIDNKRLYVKE